MNGTRRRRVMYRVLLGIALLLACGFGSAGGYQLVFLLHPDFSRNIIGYQEYTICALLLLVLPMVVLGAFRPRWVRWPLLALAACSFVQALLLVRLTREGFAAGTLALALAEGVYATLAGCLFRSRTRWPA